MKLKPSCYKKGDVVFITELNHPICLYKQKKDNSWVGIILTSEQRDGLTIEKVNSRFEFGYFTVTLTSVFVSDKLKYFGNIGNSKQLKLVYESIVKSYQI